MIIQKTVSICGEVNTLLSIVETMIVDVKAGKTPAQIIGDVVPSLITALTAIGDLKTEVADKKDLEMTVGVKAAEILNVLMP